MEKSLVLIDGENVIRSWWFYCKASGLNENIDYLKLDFWLLLRGVYLKT